MKTVYVATKNSHKVREIGEILKPLGLDVRGVEAFTDYQSPAETGESFVSNAHIKAKALYHYLKSREIDNGEFSIIADDSGLVCDDLEGAPGIHSARFSSENATDEENNAKLVSEIQKVTHPTRAARYVCALVMIMPNGDEKEIVKTCEGHIVLVPKGSNGFGYDPYFYLEDYEKTMAELDPQEKNKISHRGKALKELLGLLTSAVV